MDVAKIFGLMVVYMKDSGRMTKLQEWADSYMKMATYIQGNSGTVKLMDQELSLL